MRCHFISISEINGCQLHYYDDGQQHDDVLNKFFAEHIFQWHQMMKITWSIPIKWAVMVEGIAFNIKSLAFVNGSNGDLIKERQKKTVYGITKSVVYFALFWVSINLFDGGGFYSFFDWLAFIRNKMNHVAYFVELFLLIFFILRREKKTFNVIIGT